MALDLGSASLISGVSVKVTLNPIALNFLLRSPSGAVGVFILSLAEKTVLLAKTMAPVKTGRLRSSIGLVSFKPSVNGMEARIAVNVSYAQAVNYGVAGGRTIRAKNGGVLKFPSGGGPVYREQVTQGKNKPNPFFWKALIATMSSDRRVKILSQTFDPGSPL